MLPQEVGKGHPSAIGGCRDPFPLSGQSCGALWSPPPEGAGERGAWLGWGFGKALRGAKDWRRLECLFQLCLVLNLYYSSFVEMLRGCGLVVCPCLRIHAGVCSLVMCLPPLHPC